MSPRDGRPAAEDDHRASNDGVRTTSRISVVLDEIDRLLLGCVMLGPVQHRSAMAEPDEPVPAWVREWFDLDFWDDPDRKAAGRYTDLMLRVAWLRETGHRLFDVDKTGRLSAQLFDLADLLEVLESEGR